MNNKKTKSTHNLITPNVRAYTSQHVIANHSVGDGEGVGGGGITDTKPVSPRLDMGLRTYCAQHTYVQPGVMFFLKCDLCIVFNLYLLLCEFTSVMWGRGGEHM